MAIGRLSVKAGKPGRASSHSQYIARSGPYEYLLEREKSRGASEALEATRHGNMPTWAHDNPALFWQAADANERKNGAPYREFEIALPRELNPEQRLALVEAWVAQELGDRHAYQFAIHCPQATDGGEQPHAHIMFSERRLDGIERDPEQFFKRANAKNPERGGCKKGWGERPGETLTKAERAEEMKRTRGRWESICNQHLERAGVDARISMASHQARGTGLEPERKLLPSQWRDEQQRSNIIDFRAARAAREQARAGLAQALEPPPPGGAQVIVLDSRRPNHQAQALAQALEIAQATGYERLSALASAARHHQEASSHGQHHQLGSATRPAHREPEVQLIIAGRAVAARHFGSIEPASRAAQGPVGGDGVRRLHPGPVVLGDDGRAAETEQARLAGGVLPENVPAQLHSGSAPHAGLWVPGTDGPARADDPGARPGPGITEQELAAELDALEAAIEERERAEAAEEARQEQARQAEERAAALEARRAKVERAPAEKHAPPTAPQPESSVAAWQRQQAALEAMERREKMIADLAHQVGKDRLEELREARRAAEQALDDQGPRPGSMLGLGKARQQAWDKERRALEEALEKAEDAFRQEHLEPDRRAHRALAAEQVDKADPALAELAREGARLARDQQAEAREQGRARELAKAQEQARRGPRRGR